MCKFFSCIVVRDGLELLWTEQDSHETIISRAGLVDDKLENREFVRLEIQPPNEDISRPVNEWTFTVDEKGTLPRWFIANEKRVKIRAYSLLNEIIAPKTKYEKVKDTAKAEYQKELENIEGYVVEAIA